MRIFFAAGGTAGHINPAIATAQIVKEAEPDSAFLFAAAPGGLEKRLVGDAGFDTVPLKVHGLKRSLSPKNIAVLWDAALATNRAKKLLADFKPDVVFGTGGYLSYPVLRAAQRMGIPTVLHESNAIPGLSAKLLARRTDLVLLTFPDAGKQFPSHVQCVHTGTPLRVSFFGINRVQARKELGIAPQELFIVSFGGSLGADALNRLCLQLMCANQIESVRYLHATGRRNYDRVMQEFAARSLRPPIGSRIVPYIEDMPKIMAAADLVICRAGASTLSELSMLGRASVLIPYPNAASDHQRLNAQNMSELGGAKIVVEGEGAYERLEKEVSDLISDPAKRRKMELCARRLQPADSASRILNALKSLL